MTDIKHFVVKTLFFIPLLFLIAGINIAGDPAQIFKGGKYEQSVAREILQGKNVANFRDCDERLLQRFLIQGFNAPHEVVIFGSSRSLEMHASLFPGKTFFNHSVSGASIEDDIALYGMLRQKGHIPSLVILCLDPWLFNRHNGRDNWQTLQQEYSYTVSAIVPDKSAAYLPVFPAKYRELFSLSYFRASVMNLFLLLDPGRSGDDRFYVTRGMYAKELVKLSDGSITYDEETRVAGVEKVMAKAKSQIARKPAYAMGGFVRIDPELAHLFESYVRLMKNDGVRVVLYLPPYHPLVYAHLMSCPECEIIQQVERYLHEFSMREGLKLLGAYNPDSCGLTEADFYDGLHARHSAIVKILGRGGND